MIRWAAAILLAGAAPAAAQEYSPFLGEWCGIETRLWIGPGHIGFNEHTLCTPEDDPAMARAPTFGTPMECKNVYVEAVNDDGTIDVTEIPIPYMNVITLNLTEPGRLYIDLDDGTAPDLFVRCP